MRRTLICRIWRTSLPFCTGARNARARSDALSRLRRYYSRRVWADLKLEQLDDTPVNRAIRNLGEAIRNESLQADISGVLMQESVPKRILRPSPREDAQLTFFVPRFMTRRRSRTTST